MFRFNLASVGGQYEKDVGSKTTVMFANTWATNRVYEQVDVLAPYHPSLRWLIVNAFHKAKPSALDIRAALELYDRFSKANANYLRRHRFDVRILSSQWKELAFQMLAEAPALTDEASVFGKRSPTPKPSSGFKMVLLAYVACSSVDLYGFGVSADLGHGHYFSVPTTLPPATVSVPTTPPSASVASASASASAAAAGDDQLRRVQQALEVVPASRWLGSDAHSFERERSLFDAMVRGTLSSDVLRQWLPGARYASRVELRTPSDYASLAAHPNIGDVRAKCKQRIDGVCVGRNSVRSSS